VVKSTLTERAADQAGANTLKALLEGPTALTFVHGDAALAAKAIATSAPRDRHAGIQGRRASRRRRWPKRPRRRQSGGG
jgi:ribosomal protein L10